jgi:elongation factor P
VRQPQDPESRGTPTAVAERGGSSLFLVISTNQFKTGTHIEVDGQVFRILEFQHVKPGKGQAFVRTRLKNVGCGAVLDKTFRAGEKVRPVRTETRKMQYLYESGDEAVLMDLRDYEQMSLAKDVVGGALDFMVPNDEVDVLFVDDRPSDVQLPSTVEMAVTSTEPGLRGDTASGGGNKPATLESGVKVQVPLFVNEGDRVKVDTRTREYVARA